MAAKQETGYQIRKHDVGTNRELENGQIIHLNSGSPLYVSPDPENLVRRLFLVGGITGVIGRLNSWMSPEGDSLLSVYPTESSFEKGIYVRDPVTSKDYKLIRRFDKETDLEIKTKFFISPSLFSRDSKMAAVLRTPIKLDDHS
jgi:hypothetical protein